MSRIILPTADLVTEAMTVDAMFAFMPEGVRDVIVEAVLSASYRKQRQFQTSYPAFAISRGYATPLVNTVLNAYEFHYSGYLVDDTMTKEEYFDNLGKVEFITGWVETLVREMLLETFQTEHLEIYNGSEQWFGRDLIVDIEPVSERDLAYGW